MSSWGDWASKAGSFVWNASGAGNVLQGAKELYDNSGKDGTWSGMAKGAGRMLMGGTTAYTLPQRGAYSLGLKGVNWLLSPSQTTNKENIGKIVQKAGETSGKRNLIEHGRGMRFDHLSVDQFFTRHPSEFLKDYAVESRIQHPEVPGGKSAKNKTFRLRRHSTGSAIDMNKFIVDSFGIVRRPKAHLILERSDQKKNHDDIFKGKNVGRPFQADFLPMLQTKGPPKEIQKGHLELDELNVDGFHGHEVRHRSLTVTTQLSGCSVTDTRRGLVHARPNDDKGLNGKQLNDLLSPQKTFGRNDYPKQGQQAFVVAQRNRKGRTTIHFQTHFNEVPTSDPKRPTLVSRSGSKPLN